MSNHAKALVIGHVRYINILTWLRGFRAKIVNFLSFFCLSIPKRDLNTKKTTPNIEVWPESLGVMLEYWYIERGLFIGLKNNEESPWFKLHISQTIIFKEHIGRYIKLPVKCLHGSFISLFSLQEQLWWNLQIWWTKRRCVHHQTWQFVFLWCVLWPNNIRWGVDSVPEEIGRLGWFLPKLERLQSWFRWSEWWILARTG